MPLRFEYNGKLVWEGLETYKHCEGVMSDVLTISKSNYPQSHCYIARSVSEFLSEYYPAFGLGILNWITKVCRQCQGQSGPHRFNQGLTESGTASRHILTERKEFPPVQEVMVKDATCATIIGRLEAGQLRWELSTTSQRLASEVKSALLDVISAAMPTTGCRGTLFLCASISRYGAA